VGSNPTAPTIFPSENGKIGSGDTKTTQKTPEFEDGNMRFPMRIKHRGQALAKPAFGRYVCAGLPKPLPPF
jgi:hypothetical protein